MLIVPFILSFIIEVCILAIVLLQCSGVKKDKQEQKSQEPSTTSATTPKSLETRVNTETDKKKSLTMPTDEGKSKECKTCDSCKECKECKENEGTTSEFTDGDGEDDTVDTTESTYKTQKDVDVGNQYENLESLSQGLGGSGTHITFGEFTDLETGGSVVPAGNAARLDTTMITYNTSDGGGVTTAALKSSTSGDALQVEPLALKFDKDGGLSRVWLTNRTTHRLALKVKCTNNELYRVDPIYTFVEPQNQLEVEVIRLKGSASKNKADRLIFIYSDANKSVTDASLHFQNKNIDTHRKTVTLSA